LSRVESPLDSSDGSEYSRRLVVNVSMEAEDKGEGKEDRKN
jgi:hypothetical protein